MTTTIGSAIYIATGAPATNDKTGFDALTWVEIDDVITFGGFSVEQSTADSTPVKSGFTQSIVTSSKGVAAPLAFVGDATSAGQAAVKLACVTPNDYSIKVIDAGAANYKAASGIIYSYTENEISADMELGATCTFQANAPVVNATV